MMDFSLTGEGSVYESGMFARTVDFAVWNLV